ncbi:MAG: TetR family transcriptional regulator [Nocardia sp.]|uniref:TetR/AcrR family transcriptional regulator n=1 Tax=Nocardia sp. TaxID=1821 RepID=UPI00261C5CF2|nr:TetR/AcrR family transcriptional regulator C-terminal domain-containing protein [Nocardia sp.]MCU1647399.1 TetR family transcriptional regulator [Nocardia sp.]
MDAATARPRKSRRERPAKPALTYDGIISTAVQLVGSEGLERLTMRRLAAELDTGPASLYVYVANTAELHAAILDVFLGEVEVSPVAADGDWRDGLVAVLQSYTRVLLRHAALAQSALTARPSGPHYLAVLERLLELLRAGSVPDGQAAWGVDILLQVATATAVEQSIRDRDAATAGDEDAALRQALDSADESHPRIAALHDDLVSGSPEDRLDWTFRMLITGIQETARPR